MIQEITKEGSGIIVLALKSKDLEVHIMNYGCTILKVLMKDRMGNISDVVLGYDAMEDYQTKDAYLGAIVGRVANRIKNGTFTLNNETYTLAINSGPNHLHGGIKGFSYQYFDYEILDASTVRFTYLSKDQEEGYPGDLDCQVTYRLEGTTLHIMYHATTDKDTLINLTNHSYFNLAGQPENIENHILQVKADCFACVDKNGLPTGKMQEVTDTAFDFRTPKRIKDEIYKQEEQLILGKGYDHPFLFNATQNQVTLVHEESGRQLTVSTTLPGAQIYTANYLDGRIGKYQHKYEARSAICVETQNLPDAIHLEKEPSTILRKGEVYEETTSYTFEVLK